MWVFARWNCVNFEDFERFSAWVEHWGSSRWREEVSREINRSGYGVFSEDFYSFFLFLLQICELGVKFWGSGGTG